MNTKTKIYVVLAFVVAAFYAFEVALTLMNQGLVGPAFVKAGIVLACLYFGISRILKSRASNAPRGQ